MYPHKPHAVYVTQEVYEDPRCVTRLDRMVEAMDRPQVTRVDDAQLSTLALANGWHDPRRKGEIRGEAPDPVLFTKLKWLSPDQREAYYQAYPVLKGVGWPKGKLAGHMGFDLRGPASPRPGGTICQSAWEMHSIAGCPYMCDYCSSLSEVIVIGLNVEDFMTHMDEWVASCPEQTLFKWDNASDTLCFEPEFGATRPLIEYFARKEGKYFLLYAGKCADVDWLLDLDHRGKTIMAFSLSGPTQSTQIEKNSNTTAERIEAMAKCEAAGYIPRARFAPIVPVRNWRDENRSMIQDLFAKCTPDILSIDTIQRMSAMQAHRCMDLSLWDPTFVEAMDAAAEEMGGKTYGPLPYHKRLEVYHFIIDEVRRECPGIPIGLCLESYEMWQELEPVLGMRADHYLCNCGPLCTPGTEMYRELGGLVGAGDTTG